MKALKNRKIRLLVWIALTPTMLFTLLMILLYVPPIQNFIVSKVSHIASNKTGMNISVGKVNLRFPLNVLVSGVEVIDKGDTLLNVGSLNAKLSAWSLIKGDINVKKVALNNLSVNSADLIRGIKVRGRLSKFSVDADGIDILNEKAKVNLVDLRNVDAYITIDSIVSNKDTVETKLNWLVKVANINFDKINLNLSIPKDSIRTNLFIKKTSVKNIDLDLNRGNYYLGSFFLDKSNLTYSVGEKSYTEGFDINNIFLKDITLDVDSIRYSKNELKANIKSAYALEENSGFGIYSVMGKIHSNDSLIFVPNLNIKTLSSSEINLDAKIGWGITSLEPNSVVELMASANVSKLDLELINNVPKEIRDSYPNQDIKMLANVKGRLGELKVNNLSLRLDNSFNIKGSGYLSNITDSIKRAGIFSLDMNTSDMKFVSKIASGKDVNSIIVPDSIQGSVKVKLRGNEIDSRVRIASIPINALFDGKVDIVNKSYSYNLDLNNAYISNIMSSLPLHNLSAKGKISGKGFDFKSKSTTVDADLFVRDLSYDKYNIDSISAIAKISRGVANLSAMARGDVANVRVKASYDLSSNIHIGNVQIKADKVDLHKLEIAEKPLKKDFSYDLFAAFNKDSINARLVTGDLIATVRGSDNVNQIQRKFEKLLYGIKKQIEDREINHHQITKDMPNLSLYLSFAKENPLSYVLEQNKVKVNSTKLMADAQVGKGLYVKANSSSLKVDTVLIDNIDFELHQDTSSVRYDFSVVNDKNNEQYSFDANISGHILSKEAKAMLNLKDRNRDTGVMLGVNVVPDSKGKDKGFLFLLTPDEPILAYRKFKFNNGNNTFYINDNMRVYSNVDMRNVDNTAIRIVSSETDTVSLQNTNIEIRNLILGDISKAFPYIPQIAGELSAEAHYIQTKEKLQLSTDVNIYGMSYEKQQVGDVSLGATWMPATDGKQYVNMYLNYEDDEVFLANGKLIPNKIKKDSIDVSTTLSNFPLHIANLFIPKQLVSLQGGANGDINVTGILDNPIVDGSINMNEVSLKSSLYGVNFRLDPKELKVKRNKIFFDKYAIYSVNDNPFLVNGTIDFNHMSMPYVDIKMNAYNYTLLNAPKTKESLLYGKVFVDFNSYIRGKLDNLSMRGNVNFLGNTDVSYVYADSPLTVQDRLNNLVTFTSFSDTITKPNKTLQTMSLGGLDMLMTVHIDPSVRMKVDLDENSDNRVELEGGGNLSVKYSPQGDMLLNGRYTLTGGLMKYSLPIIAAKKFSINNDSYIEWNGKLSDPFINFKATDRIKANVPDGETGNSRSVNFDVSVVVKNKLNDLEFAFDVAAPEDSQIQNELTSMGQAERGKQALYIMVTKSYLGKGNFGSGGGKMPNMSSALNSVLASQINSLLGNIKNANISFGVENHNDLGTKRTDYSFRYSQRLFDNRFQIIVGGRVSTGANARNDLQSFIDNISLEYRLDRSGTRYVRLFYDKNYESILDEEVIETGAGVVLRKKVDRLSELFIFKRRKKNNFNNEN